MEISTDQNTIKLEFDFVERKPKNTKTPDCLFCDFNKNADCLISCKDVPCIAAKRKDKNNGYYKLKSK